MPNNFLSSFYKYYHKTEDFGIRNISNIIYVLIAVLSLDTVVNVLSAGIGIPVSSIEGVTAFVIIGSVTIVCQLFILQFIC